MRFCDNTRPGSGLCWHLESRHLTLPAASLYLYQGFSSDRWSWKRSRVGAHAVEFIDQWVTSELVSILTSCSCSCTAFQTQQAGNGIYEQQRQHSMRHCVIRVQVEFVAYILIVNAVGLSQNKGSPRHSQASFVQNFSLTPLLRRSCCRPATDARQMEVVELLGVMPEECP